MSDNNKKDMRKWFTPRLPIWVKEEDIPRLPTRRILSVIGPFVAQLKTRPMEWAIYADDRRIAMAKTHLPHTDSPWLEVKNRLFVSCPGCKKRMPWRPKGCEECQTITQRSEATWRIYLRWTGELVELETEDED